MVQAADNPIQQLDVIIAIFFSKINYNAIDGSGVACEFVSIRAIQIALLYIRLSLHHKTYYNAEIFFIDKTLL